MTTSLLTGLHTETDICFAKTPAGEVFMVNGIDRGHKWDGAATSTVFIGLDAPTVAPTVGENSGGHSEVGEYFTAYRFGDEVGNYSNLSPLQSTTTTAVDKSFDWSAVAVAAGTDSTARITKRQLFRSLVGDATTLFLVTTLADNTTTTYSDTLSDEDLAQNEELPIVNFDETLSANRFGLPPTTKAVAVWHQDRMFYLADSFYSTGTVTVTSSSTTVTGIGTAFNKYFVGRYLYPVGAAKGLRISAYVSATELTLGTAYAGSTLTGVAYEIRPDPAERGMIFFSETEEPESVPQSQNQFVLQENVGEYDEIVGAIPSDSTMYVLQRSHVYAFDYVRQPHLDGSARLMLRRGCCNQRCWDRGGNSIFLMDQEGPYSIQSGGDFKDIGEPIKNYWRDGLIDHSQSRRFFVAVNPQTQTARFYVRLTTDNSVVRCLAYDYAHDAWSEEEYPFTVGCAVAMRVNNVRSYFVGKQNDRFCAERYLSSLDGRTSAVRGTVASYGAGTLVATGSVFVAGMIDCPVVITSTNGKRQVGLITAYTNGTTVTVATTINSPTAIAAGDTFVIGGVPWSYRTGLMTYARNEHNNHERSIELLYKPTTESGNTLDIRHYLNYKTTAEVAQFDEPEKLSQTCSSISGSADGVVTLDRDANADYPSVGYSRKVYSGRNAHGIAADRYVTAELRGIAAGEPVEVSQLVIAGSK